MLFRSHRLTNRLQTKNYALLSTIASTTTTSSLLGNKSSSAEFNKTTNNNNNEITINNNNIMIADVASISNNFSIFPSSASSTSLLRRPTFAAETKNNKKTNQCNNASPSSSCFQQMRFCSTVATTTGTAAAESSSPNNNANNNNNINTDEQKSAEDAKKKLHDALLAAVVDAFKKILTLKDDNGKDIYDANGNIVSGENEIKNFLETFNQSEKYKNTSLGKILDEWYDDEKIASVLNRKHAAAVLSVEFDRLVKECKFKSDHFSEFRDKIVPKLIETIGELKQEFEKKLQKPFQQLVKTILEKQNQEILKEQERLKEEQKLLLEKQQSVTENQEIPVTKVKDEVFINKEFFTKEGLLGRYGVAVIGNAVQLCKMQLRWIKTPRANILLDSTVLLAPSDDDPAALPKNSSSTKAKQPPVPNAAAVSTKSSNSSPSPSPSPSQEKEPRLCSLLNQNPKSDVFDQDDETSRVLIFTGGSGTGKTTVALLASASAGPTPEPICKFRPSRFAKLAVCKFRESRKINPEEPKQ